MRLAALGATLLLAGCGGSLIPEVRPAGHVPVPAAAPAPASVAAIKGQTAQRLIGQLGKPQLDLTEGAARKLQFGGPICVLDAYPYPPSGRADPIVTHIDTRQRDGSPIDAASCLAALARRPGTP